MRFLSLLIATLMLFSCSQDKEAVTHKQEVDVSHDYFSYANTDQFVTEHLRLNLTVDFDRKELRGLAILTMKRLDVSATDIILDTRDLHIDDVLVAGSEGDGSEAKFEYSQQDPILGQALKITLPDGLEQQQNLTVKIHYKTDPGASALQWLPKELTAGGEHPFMFSQSQSIHARSWVPLQDTPSVRITYDATIHTPAQLLAVMSADNDPLTTRSGEYHFNMPQAIPSYLLAIELATSTLRPLVK